MVWLSPRTVASWPQEPIMKRANISAALGHGYAVLISDNPGYTNESSIPAYMVGSHRRMRPWTSLLRQAEFQVIDPDANVAIWGYSQGGQTAAWAGELQPHYAPDMKLVGGLGWDTQPA